MSDNCYSIDETEGDDGFVFCDVLVSDCAFGACESHCRSWWKGGEEASVKLGILIPHLHAEGKDVDRRVKRLTM